MNRVYIESVGLFAPGLGGWHQGQSVLTGESVYEHAPLPRYKPQLLAGNERRRATNSVRIAFGACEDAVGERLAEARELAGVFVSSGGDYGVHDQICRGLLQEPVMLSPTQFHNSVHNAPAGYWSIASESKASSVSLSVYDYSVAGGLLEAVPMVAQQSQAALLVFSDCDTCSPMNQKRAVNESFAAALWLTPGESDNSLASLEIALEPGVAEDCACPSSGLEALRLANPAARILPLLQRLARRESGRLAFPMASGQRVAVTLESLCAADAR